MKVPVKVSLHLAGCVKRIFVEVEDYDEQIDESIEQWKKDCSGIILQHVLEQVVEIDYPELTPNPNA